jgi:hypothetical protein
MERKQEIAHLRQAPVKAAKHYVHLVSDATDTAGCLCSASSIFSCQTANDQDWSNCRRTVKSYCKGGDWFLGIRMARIVPDAKRLSWHTSPSSWYTDCLINVIAPTVQCYGSVQLLLSPDPKPAIYWFRANKSLGFLVSWQIWIAAL